MQPIISIIVPVYNVEKYVSKCIESVLNQTFDNIELILVDDGSKDSSGDICDKYLEVDRRVRVIHQKNKGLSGARNRGICGAKGEYISFVDSDDCIAPEFCEIMYGMLETSQSDFAVCKFQKFTCEEEIFIGDVDIQEFKVSNYDYFINQLNSGFSACAKLYRKEIFESNSFYEGKLHEDIIWSADLAKNFHKGVCCTDLELYYYRQNNESIMAASRVKCSPDRVYAGEYLLNIVKQEFPELISKAFKYGIMLPWSYVDGIYVHRTFKENKQFLKELKRVLKDNRCLLKTDKVCEIKTIRHRMSLFSMSLILYACNAYVRLFRVYLYKLFRKDAYEDGHGI